MKATLILLLETQHAEKSSEGSVHADLPLIFGARRFQEPTHIRPFTWPEWGRVALVSSYGSRIAARLAMPMKSPATKSTCCWCITVRTARNKFFTISRFWHLLSMWSDILGWARRDWLRGGVRNFTPMSGFVQLLKINNQNGLEMGHQNSACAQQFQRTKKLTTTRRFATDVHLTERFTRGPNS